jgi:hypothetical protein
VAGGAYYGKIKILERGKYYGKKESWEKKKRLKNNPPDLKWMANAIHNDVNKSNGINKSNGN